MHRHVQRLVRSLSIAAASAALLATAIAAPASVGAADGNDKGGGYRQVGYFVQWGIYGRSFFVKNLETSGAANRLTHIDYAFAGVGADGRCLSVDPWADFQRPVSAEESVDGVADAWGEPLNGNFDQLRKLKAKHPNLKVLLSIGGWTLSAHFSDAALTDASRRAFVASCIDQFIKGDLPADGSGSGGPAAAAGVFDGFDIDWEWPGSEANPGNVVRPEDKQNYTKLLAEFRRQLRAYGKVTHRKYQLTAFLPANPATIDAGFEGRRIFHSLDFATVQGYDFHVASEPITNQQSALRVPSGSPSNPDFSIELAVSAWRSRGAPAKKLVLGIPYYGHGWTGVTGGINGLFGAASGPAPGTWEAGSEDYKVLATKAGNGFTVYRDNRAGHAWLFDGTTFWTYDDPLVVQQKIEWLRARGLGGAMVWSLDADDANATLTKTISGALRSD